MQHDRKTLDAQGVSLAYTQIGEGPPVVYIHGALTTLEEGFAGLGATLAPRFHLTAFDRPGHGESGKDATTGSVWRQAELITSAIAALGISKPVVVGHSFGGAVALAMAIQSPESVASVVALAPIAFPEPRLEVALLGPRAWPVTGAWVSGMSSLADAVVLPVMWRGMFLPQSMTPAFVSQFPVALAGGYSQVRADGQDALMMMGSLMGAAAKYQDCQTPVHIVQGDRDLVVNPAMHGRPLAAILPNAQFTWLPGLGHLAHHFAPEVVADAIGALSSPARVPN